MDKPTPAIDYTNLDYEALREAMLDIAQQTLPEWTDLSENDLGVLLIELFAYANDITLYYQTRIASNLFPQTSDDPQALVQLLRLIGYELSPPAPATVNLRVAFDATTPTPITVPAGTQFIVSLSTGEQVLYETARQLEISDAQLTPADAAGLRYFLPVPVVQGETVADEVAGEADGTPNQMVTLQRAPVIAGSVAVRVTEPGGVETRWEQVETLSASEPLDRHFVVQRDSDGHATLVFGDGINGMVLPAGLSSSPTTIYATYRVGGGTIGNVPAGSTFRSSLALIRQATNPTAAAGGTPKESLDRARFFAPRLYRTQERAVTAPDYAVLARQVAGVGKARAVALSWNQIALYIAPTGEGVAEPSELLKRDLLAAFESRRMAAVQVRILPARPADIYITATVQAQPYFLQDDVRDAVEGAVMAYLSFESVDFAQPVYLSRIYDVIQSLPSVISVNITEFSTAPYSQAISSDGTIQADPDQIPRLGYLHNPTTPPTPGVLESRRALRLTIEGGVAW